MIRILLAEDQAMVRGALSALLGLEPDIEVLGSAADGEAAWRMLQQLQPDILVTDIEMPGLSGLELAQRIARHELPIKVVIVTTFARAGFLRRALEAGVLGYLLKDAPAENLAEALRKVKQGIRAIDPQLALDAWSQADPLTDRERRVLRLAGEGRHRQRDRRAAGAVARHGAQLPVRMHRQAGCGQPDRGVPAGAAEGVVVGGASLSLLVQRK
ncbi:response regulator transcription factor [Stenotrophomonas indicatrix]|nr:response regulator transcription factor [Stenotrophomonas indicatrix]MDT9583218.1 response regulator transcription factor [Stenotrophomonas indicatrix]